MTREVAEMNEACEVQELQVRLQALGYEFEEEPDELGETETVEEVAGAVAPEEDALILALRRARNYARGFCNLVDWDADEELAPALREALLDLAAAYFLQAKMALQPDKLAVMPTLTSLRLGDAAWSFGGGTQRSGTDALTRAEALVLGLRREAQAVLCAWRSIY